MGIDKEKKQVVKPDISMYKELFFKKKGKNPDIVETVPFNLEKFNESRNSFVLFGHSTVLLKLQGVCILTDPIFHKKPVGPFNVLGMKPFRFRENFAVENLPSKIDVVVISHNHYDHLDKPTVQLLKNISNMFLVPKGVAALLHKWGVDESRVKELNWDEETEQCGIQFTYLKSQHFSGRGLFDRDKTLWGSWHMQGIEKGVFFTGDTGYSNYFKEYGKRFKNIDLALLECGAYSKYWAYAHMLPEESVAAAIDLNAKLAIPIHNRKYDLSIHHWLEPTLRFEDAAKERGIPYVIPEIGEVIEF